MSRIFISHSAKNNREATALKLWLESQGWKDEVFLDLDPVSGIKSGTRWKKALSRANSACEAIICLTSPEWVGSAECVAEFRTAENNGKQVFVAQISELGTVDNTREWQGIRLFGDGPKTMIHVGESREPVQFMVEGLARLKYGLLDAGVSGLLPRHFPWPPSEEPDRAPYRGLEPLDVIDAGIFFGRDAEILRGLAEIERMRLAADLPLFVILGASGAGKSSFLRAGLLPRLRNDDRRFFSLGIVRPDSHPIYGDRGLAQAIASAVTEQLTPRALNPGKVKDMLRRGSQSFVALLKDIQAEARGRVIGLSETAPAPTLLLAIDQAEELFSQDATEESRTFLELIGTVVRRELRGVSNPVSIIIALTIRSDRYEPLQTCPQLAGIKSVLFDDLRPMPSSQYKEIIVNPASRAQVNGQPLNVEPALVQELLSESAKGADTLPLLSLTLARLYRDYSNNGDLLLNEYRTMGGMKHIITTEAESVLSSKEETRKGQLQQLHAAFIPWLADINQDNDSPMRRVAVFAKLPPESQPLVQALVEKRLLLSDSRDGERVVEVAHESLFRQWKVLADWLDAHREDLKETNRLEQDARAWRENGKKDEWLRAGERLRIGEQLAGKKNFKERLEDITDFLQVSREREETRKQGEENKRQAEIKAAKESQAAAEKLADAERRAAARAMEDSARLRKGRMWLAVALTGALIATVMAIWFAVNSRKQSEQATALRLNTEAQLMFAGERSGGIALALSKIIAAHRIAQSDEIESTILSQVLALQRVEKIMGFPISVVALSQDGTRLVSSAGDETVQLRNGATGLAIWPPWIGRMGLVKCVAISADGMRVISGDEDGTISLWDGQTGQPIGAPLTGHEGDVLTLAVNKNGDHMVSGGRDGTVRLWNGRTGQPIGPPTPAAHEAAVTYVAMSADGMRVVSRHEDGTVQLWNGLTGKTLGSPLADSTFSIAMSGDGSRVVSAGLDGMVRLWNGLTGQPIGEPLKGHGTAVFSVAISQDGKWVVSGDLAGMVRLWNVGTGAPIGLPISAHRDTVVSVAVSADGMKIVSGGRDGTVRLWNGRTGQPIGPPTPAAHKAAVTYVAMSADGMRVVSRDEDGTVQLWNTQIGRSIGHPIPSRSGTVISVVANADDIWVASRDEGGSVRLWNGRTGQPIGPSLSDLRDSKARGVMSVEGMWVALISQDGTVQLWDGRTGQPIGRPLKGHEGPVTSVAISRDGTRVASGDFRGTVQLWDGRTGQPIGKPLKGHEGTVTSVAISRDERWVVSGGEDGMVQLWDGRTGQPIGKPLKGHEGTVASVAISGDERRVVSGGEDGMVRLWNGLTGEPIGSSVRGHDGLVLSIAISEDGVWGLSGDVDGMVRVWNGKTGQPMGPLLPGHEGKVTSVAMSADGLRGISGGSDGNVRLWPRPNDWPEMLCAKLARNLSHKEWREHVSSALVYIPQCAGLPIPPDEPVELKTHNAGSEVR